MSYAIYIPSGWVIFIKRNRLTHTCPKTRGPSKSQKHAWRTKQVSQFTLRKCWAGSGTYLDFIKYKMKQTLDLLPLPPHLECLHLWIPLAKQSQKSNQCSRLQRLGFIHSLVCGRKTRKLFDSCELAMKQSLNEHEKGRFDKEQGFYFGVPALETISNKMGHQRLSTG